MDSRSARSFFHIGDKGASLIGENFTWWKIKKLELSANKISNAGVKTIGENYAWHQLQELNLAHNKIGAEGVY